MVTAVNGFVRFEGEAALAALSASDKLDAKALSRIPNLRARIEGEIIRGPASERIRIQNAPAPRFDPAYIEGAVELPVLVGRGCYYKCAFCDYPALYAHTSFAPPERVEAAVRSACDQSPIRDLHFVYEVLPLTYEKRLTARLIETGIPIRWRGFQRVFGELSAADVKSFEISGCRRLDVGLECADDATLALIRKGYRTGEIERFFSAFAGSNIELLVNIIVDLPRLSFERAMAAAAFLERTTGHLDTIHFELMDFALTAQSEMHRDPESFGLRLKEDLAPGAGGAFLSLNRTPFKADLQMTAQEREAIKAEYRRMNSTFRLRRRERLARLLRSRGASAVEVRVSDGPYLIWERADQAREILVRDLGLRETYVLPDVYREAVIALDALAGANLSIDDLRARLRRGSLHRRDIDELLATLLAFRPTRRTRAIRNAFCSDRNFYRGAVRPSMGMP
jgi:radical SAM superfamily enzyme YgiQ (UPF0313 family)